MALDAQLGEDLAKSFSNLDLESEIPPYPSSHPNVNVIDIYRNYLTITLHKVTGIDEDIIYPALAPHWQETEVLAQRLGVTCITRTVGGGAKAGNIENARQQLKASGEALIVIFDADQIAQPEFLLKTVSPFADPGVGWVQTGQYYYNLDNPVARWANDQQGLFYRVLCPGKSAQNAAFICGTNVMLRGRALDEIGGLPQNSVTEDFEASIRLHPRWRGIFLSEELAHGLGPLDLASYFGQQRRWAIGTLGVLRSHWRALILPQWDGLSVAQRVQYGLACTHYLCGVRDLIYIIAPLVFLVTHTPAVRGAYLSTFLWHFLPYWAASQVAFWYVARGKTSLGGIVIGFGSFPALLGSFLTVLRGGRGTFTVTSKTRARGRRQWPLLPHVIALVACLVALGITLWPHGAQGPVLVSVLWVGYTVLMLGGMLWLGLEDERVKRGWRWPTVHLLTNVAASVPRLGRLAYGSVFATVMLAMIIFVVEPAVALGPVVTFNVAQDTGSRPYLGIWLPDPLLVRACRGAKRTRSLRGDRRTQSADQCVI